MKIRHYQVKEKTIVNGWNYEVTNDGSSYWNKQLKKQWSQNMKKYKRFMKLLSEYKSNPTGKAKMKVYNESYRLLSLGLCGHLGVN